MKDLAIRPYRPADAAALAEIFYRAVREGARSRYSDEQRRAWAPEQPDPQTWARRLEGLITVVAVAGGRPVGFMSLRPDGYLDLAFVLPKAMGRGVADALYQDLVAEARQRGIVTLTTEASHLARPFFLRQGWRLVSANTVARGDVKLMNFLMEYSLTPIFGPDADGP
ncbi:MAG: GNAT family N-acetyltransferase [Rhodobacter sp.]|nr:GNAT family N-acetyltransferase [Rhodobacter sp.]